MSAFLNRCSFDVWGDTDWVLLEPLRYRSSILGEVIVPEAFITDLASIPKVARSVIPQNGRHRYAAIVHDWIYATAGGASQLCDRHTADCVFMEAMIVLGVPWSKRHLMYAAVRVGGWVTWNARQGLTPFDIGCSRVRPLSAINAHTYV